MGSALASRSQDRRVPASVPSSEILGDLIEHRRRVQVRLESIPGMVEWDGVIVGATPDQLSLELATPNANGCAIQVSTSITVVFETGHACYTFRAACVAVETGIASTLVRVERPARVAKIERRRSPRRGLRDPIRVRIQADCEDHALDESASLLNLSADGLACRIRNSAEAVAVGDVVRVSFELEWRHARFELRARAINITRGASDDRSILGLEFISDAILQEDRDRLVMALAATRSS